MLDVSKLIKKELDNKHHIWLGKLPKSFDLSIQSFQQLWDLHPPDYHTLVIRGQQMKTPRWQQAYGKNYSYTGSKNNALPISDELTPFHEWCKTKLDPRFNGLLVNWYEGQKKHYIGAHRDDTRELIAGSSIATISLGQERIFRMRPWKQQGYRDLVMGNGTIIVIPWDTNLSWTHEVPKFSRYQGRRLSITLRVFK